MIPSVDVDRRSFLKRGLLGGALLAIGGSIGLGVWPSRIRYQPKRPLQVLDERRFAVLAAVASRTVRTPGADPAAIAQWIDDFASRSDPQVQSDLRQLLMLFENGFAGLLFDGRPMPFTHLSPEQQDAALEHWRDSRLTVRRAGYRALKQLTVIGHYIQPASWAGVGYPGPPQLAVPT